MALGHDFVREHLIEPDEARRFAAAELHLGIRSNTPGMEGWRAVNLGTPTVVHDLNGLPLFYDVPVVDPEGDHVGMVRANASRVLGSLATAVYLGGPRWNAAEAELRVRRLIRDRFDAEVTEARLVCYAYPKLGIAVEWRDKDQEPHHTVFDIGDLSEVPDRSEPGWRGPGAMSIYESMDEHAALEAVEAHGRNEALIEEIQGRANVDLVAHLDWSKFDQVQSTVGVLIPAYTTKKLTFCTHSWSHECMRMHGQETGVWCVVATGQMILDFWRYYEAQTDIATAMSTTSNGTDWGPEQAGLEALTCGHFDASADFSPTFKEVMYEIDENRPFDYSYTKHAMACAGYRRQNIVLWGSTPKHSVYLYDPWPVNTGTIRWETFGAVTVAGFVYLRRN